MKEKIFNSYRGSLGVRSRASGCELERIAVSFTMLFCLGRCFFTSLRPKMGRSGMELPFKAVTKTNSRFFFPLSYFEKYDKGYIQSL